MKKFNLTTAGSGGDLLSDSPPSIIENDALSKQTLERGIERRFSEDDDMNGMLPELSSKDKVYTLSGSLNDIEMAVGLMRLQESTLTPKDKKPDPNLAGRSSSMSSMSSSARSRPSLSR